MSKESTNLFYYPRQIFKDNIYLLNTCPLALVLMDEASVYYTQGIDVASLDLQGLMDLLHIDESEGWEQPYKVFSKKWPYRQEELDKAQERANEIADKRSTSSRVNGRLGGRPRKDSDSSDDFTETPETTKPATPQIPGMEWVNRLTEICKAQGFPDRRVKLDEVAGVAGRFAEATPEVREAILNKYESYLEGHAEEGTNPVGFTKWIKALAESKKPKQVKEDPMDKAIESKINAGIDAKINAQFAD